MNLDLFAPLPVPPSRAAAFATGDLHVESLSVEELAGLAAELNEAYRAGRPLVSDARYDVEIISVLRALAPDHPFLQEPEPEADGVFKGARYRHTVEMKSTEKCYRLEEVVAWLRRVEEAAAAVGVARDAVRIRSRPKLDGIAAMRYPDALVTRGANGYGTDISHVLSMGVVKVGEEAVGKGEIVIEKQFFDEQLAEQFDLDHPRNFCAGIVAADDTKDYHSIALEAGVVRFVMYSALTEIVYGIDEFMERWEVVLDDLQKIEYLCDGVVSEVIDPRIVAQMGSSSRAHRWQIALKRNEEGVETEVETVRLTTGRTSRITPTLMLKPVQAYGVTISKATAHTAGHLAKHGLGPGARILVTRAGGVIPTFLRTVTPAVSFIELSKCPSCGGPTEFENDYLVCPSRASCPAQASRSLQHWFSTVATARGFGPGICHKLTSGPNALTVADVFAMSVDDFVQAGISAGVAKNLVAELERCRAEPIPENVFVGALGVRHCGRGDAAALLRVFHLRELGSLSAEQIAAVKGFGEVTSPLIAEGLRRVWPVVERLLGMGFNLEPVPAVGAASSPISGLSIVFTGSMESDDRNEMEAKARTLGAAVGSSVTSKTSLLVCGAKVGAKKSEAAKALGVRVITEGEYLALLHSA